MKIKQHCSNSDRIGFVRSIIPGLARRRRLWTQTWTECMDWTGHSILKFPMPSLQKLLHVCLFPPPRLQPAADQRASHSEHRFNIVSNDRHWALGSGAGEAKTFNLIIMMAGGWSVSSVRFGSDGRARSIFYGVLIDFGIETALTLGKTGEDGRTGASEHTVA